MVISRKFWVFLLVGLLSLGLMFAGCAPEEVEEDPDEPEEVEEVEEEPEEEIEYPRELTFTHTHTASGWYVWASTYTSLANEHSDILDITLIESGGAAEAFEMGLEGMADIFNANAIEVLRAVEGEGDYEPQEDLRGLHSTVSAPNVLAVRADADIENFEDLDGKPINPGGMGTATELIVEDVMELFGIEPDYQRMGMDDAADAFRDGDIVAFFKTAAAPDYPDALIQELELTMDLEIISLTEEQAEMIEDAGIAFTYETPPGTYEGQDEPILSKGTAYVHNTYKDRLTAEEAYEFSSINMQHQDLLEGAAPGPGVEDPVQLTFDTMPWPLHVGVIELLLDMGYDLDDIPDVNIPPEFEE